MRCLPYDPLKRVYSKGSKRYLSCIYVYIVVNLSIYVSVYIYM